VTRSRKSQAPALAARQFSDRRPRLLGPEQEVFHVADDVTALIIDGQIVAAAASQGIE
jgi:hypothetical protein